jgi:hypothetical protein
MKGQGAQTQSGQQRQELIDAL